MKFGNIFSRNQQTTLEKVPTSQPTKNDKVVCDTTELKQFICSWTRNEGFTFENFADLAELVGLKTPIQLSGLNPDKNSFKCITALNTETEISLRFGDWMEFPSEIWLTEGEETRVYETYGNSKKLNVSLSSRHIKRSGKELHSFYSKYFCRRTLKIDNTYTLLETVNKEEHTRSTISLTKGKVYVE